mmetsp:Transcript_37608/g.52230  ORF Transcript_37608/g.52230 Transcript_37608/m.52230 type:complete len:308 (-) Transcript_37608:247-1170(-)
MAVIEGLVSFSASFLFYLIARATNREASRVRNTKQISSFNELLNQIDDSKSSEFVLTGTVSSPSPLSSQHSPGTQGVILKTFTERHYLRRPDLLSDWARGTQLLSRRTEEAPWCLEDGSGCVVWVEGAKDVAPTVKVSESLDESLTSFLDTSLAALRHATGIKHIGLGTTEHMLTLGTPLTVLGQVSATGADLSGKSSWQWPLPRHHQDSGRAHGLAWRNRAPLQTNFDRVCCGRRGMSGLRLCPGCAQTAKKCEDQEGGIGGSAGLGGKDSRAIFRETWTCGANPRYISRRESVCSLLDGANISRI